MAIKINLAHANFWAMNQKRQHEITCPSCSFHFNVEKFTQLVKFCPACKYPLHSQEDLTHATRTAETHESLPFSNAVTLIPGHAPEHEQIQFEIGPYQILQSIGKGGMGEVFLAYDTSCGRRIALKRIRTDLTNHVKMHNRFLKEARVTSQLTHPAIIPIYSIHSDPDLVYYTMPFVEGLTLKQILKTAQKQHKDGHKIDQSSSIPALVRIFLSVCQAVAYAHSKGVLHRDLKPENIIVGQYGEVLILDWGLAKLIRTRSDQDEEDGDDLQNIPEPEHALHGITHMGKAVGTISYMAPERALGQPASLATDIYSLGVILYQLLTLRAPFVRRSLKEFRKTMTKEVLMDPMELAPYRDVPKVLSRVACKCLEFKVEERYETVDDLIHDLESYIEGRSEWFQITQMDVHRKSDWEFQENVLIAEHMAITRGTEVSDWVSLMISKTSYPENTKIEAKVRIGETGRGIGFLLSIPEGSERIQLNSGYCLWLGSDLDKSTKLLRATVEVMYAPEIYLQRNEWYQVRIEKIDNNIHFFLNDVLQFSYISHLPLIGTHLGLLSRDADFTLKDFSVFVGSQSIKVNCLAVPDAFLAHKDYATALSEYRRIAYSFPGTAEGREAMFRAGITLLEEARACNDPAKSIQIFEQSLEEFSKLHKTPGAPLGYLGKALVYKSLKDYEEEVKCFELAYRRYPHHPLLPVLQEQLVYRMHESSHVHRRSTYQFVLLAVRHLSMELASKHTKKLYTSLWKHWEPLYFIEEPHENGSWKHPEESYIFATQLAFWLAQPYTILEIISDILNMPNPPLIALGDALFALLELGCTELATKQLEIIEQRSDVNIFKSLLDSVRISITSNSDLSKACVELCQMLKQMVPTTTELRTAFYLMERAIGVGNPATIHLIAQSLVDKDLPAQVRTQIDAFRIWAYLIEHNWYEAGEILQRYPVEQLTEETSILYFLYGCWLYVTEVKVIADIHFSAILDIPQPRSWSLFSHFYKNETKLRHWVLSAFLWEKRQLYRQYMLFYSCAGDTKQVKHYQNLEKQEYINVI